MNESDGNHKLGEAPGSTDRQITLSDRVRSLRLPDRPRRGLNGLALILGMLCVALAGSTGYLGWRVLNPAEGKDDKSAAAEVRPNTKAPDHSQLAWNPAPQDTGGVALTSKGYIIPLHQIQVSPKVGGMVMELNIEEGMRIKEGDIVAKIETTEYKADYDRAQGAAGAAKHRWQELWKYRDDEIRQLKADLDDSKAQREQLLSDWRRSIALKNANSLSSKEYEQAESSYKSMDFRVQRLKLALDLLIQGPRDERIAAAKSEKEQAEADLAKAKWRLDNCTVVAPVSGTILSKKAEKGNQVNPAAFSNGLSASLCDMADLSDMEVDLAIAERDIGKVFKGQKCQVKAEAFMDRAYEGVVSRIMPTADRGKNAVPVRVKIFIPREEEGQYLRPEMGALVTFYAEKRK